LTAADKGDFNTLDNPGVVKPVELMKTGDKKGKVVLAPNSLNLFVMSYSL
jgi:hypothetical protein